MPHTTLSGGFLALCRLIVLSLWLKTNEGRRRVALLGPPVSRFGIPISAASRGSPHRTGRATRSEWPPFSPAMVWLWANMTTGHVAKTGNRP